MYIRSHYSDRLVMNDSNDKDFILENYYPWTGALFSNDICILHVFNFKILCKNVNQCHQKYCVCIIQLMFGEPTILVSILQIQGFRVF